MVVEPITLVGEFVTIETLSINHVPALCDAGLDPSIWTWSPTAIDSESQMREYVETALREKERGVSLPFATREKTSGKIVGSTRFGNIDVINMHVEIGWTWLAPSWQRTYVNTEAKLLMLTPAFEVWRCIRVEFKTDVLNEKSRNALKRIGAKEEGIFRNHMITESGRFRDSIYFSIIESEWPEVRSRLEAMLKE